MWLVPGAYGKAEDESGKVDEDILSGFGKL